MIKHCGPGPRNGRRRGPKGEETGHERAKKRGFSGAGRGGADEFRRADDQGHPLERHGGEQRAQPVRGAGHLRLYEGDENAGAGQPHGAGLRCVHHRLQRGLHPGHPPHHRRQRGGAAIHQPRVHPFISVGVLQAEAPAAGSGRLRRGVRGHGLLLCGQPGGRRYGGQRAGGGRRQLLRRGVHGEHVPRGGQLFQLLCCPGWSPNRTSAPPAGAPSF